MVIFIRSLLVSMVFFMAIDLGWIKYVVNPLYKKHLPEFIADRPNAGAAIAFYILFLSGLVYFVIQPAIEKGTWTASIIPGMIYGLATYATYDLTSMAVFKNWPLIITVTDIAWGIFLAAAIASATSAVVLRFS